MTEFSVDDVVRYIGRRTKYQDIGLGVVKRLGRVTSTGNTLDIFVRFEQIDEGGWFRQTDFERASAIERLAHEAG